MKTPKISIIVPCYNIEKYIKPMIKSTNQFSEEISIETIFIDDFSKDNTLSKLKKYSNKNQIIIRNKQNLGLSVTRNIGVQKASGEYVFFLDGDDILSRDFIKIFGSFNDEQFLRKNKKRNYINQKNNFSHQVQASTFITKKDFLIRHNIKQIPNIIFEDNHYMAMIDSALEKDGVKKIKCFNNEVFKYTENRPGSIMHSSYKFETFFQSYEAMKSLDLTKRTKNVYSFQLWNSFWSYAQSKKEIIVASDVKKLKTYLKKEIKDIKFSKLPILYKLRYSSYKLFKRIWF